MGATPHGILVAWGLGSLPPSDPPTVTLNTYNVYRAPGNNPVPSAAWASISTLGALPANNQFLDAASGLTDGNFYSYGVSSVDSLNNEGAMFIIGAIQFHLLLNPNPPTTGSVKVV